MTDVSAASCILPAAGDLNCTPARSACIRGRYGQPTASVRIRPRDSFYSVARSIVCDDSDPACDHAPRYLGPLASTVDVPGRRALRSAGTNRLIVPPVRLATIGSQAFPVAAAHTWNSLPEHTVSASTLQLFKRHL